MTPPWPAQLVIESHLTLTVGNVNVTVVADGQHLVVRTNDTRELIAQSAHLGKLVPGSTSLRNFAGRAGHLLDDAGLSAQVIGEHGPLIALGRGCSSRAGRLLLGNEHASLGRPAALLAAAAAYLPTASTLRRSVRRVTAGVAVVALISGVVRRRTR